MSPRAVRCDRTRLAARLPEGLARWQAFADEALILIDRLTDRSGAVGDTVRSELGPFERAPA